MKKTTLIMLALIALVASSSAQSTDSARKAKAEFWQYMLKPFHEGLISESKAIIRTIQESDKRTFKVPSHFGSVSTDYISKKEYLSREEARLAGRIERLIAEEKEYADMASGKKEIIEYMIVSKSMLPALMPSMNFGAFELPVILVAKSKNDIVQN